jgi:hypothetical protein
MPFFPQQRRLLGNLIVNTKASKTLFGFPSTDRTRFSSDSSFPVPPAPTDGVRCREPSFCYPSTSPNVEDPLVCYEVQRGKYNSACSVLIPTVFHIRYVSLPSTLDYVTSTGRLLKSHYAFLCVRVAGLFSSLSDIAISV